MSVNQLLLPTLPPTAAAAFNGSVKMDPTSPGSPIRIDSADEGRSFLATLSQISNRKSKSHQPSHPAENTATDSGDTHAELLSPGKIDNACDHSNECLEQPVANGSLGPAPFNNPLQAFGMLQQLFFNLPMAADGSFAVETGSDSSTGSNVPSINNLMGHLQPESQGLLTDWVVGIGPFEQVQANISPETMNLFFFEHLSAKAAFNQSSGNAMGAHAQYFGFWQLMATASQGSLNAQTAHFGANVDPILTNLLQAQGTISTALGLNGEINSAAGQETAANLATANLNEDLLLKITTPFQPGDSGLSENSKMDAAGKEGRLSLWAAGEPHPENRLEMQPRQVGENFQQLKMTAAFKADAEQPANPNTTAARITTKPADDALNIKSTFLRSEILPVDALGNKISPIDGDNKDSSFFFSQDQMPEHLARLENAPRTSESVQRGPASQAMNQIVQKAVLSLNNGQNQVQIDLKPEFLGHIRMQIITESQHVAVRIVAEFPFVKNMLENNLNQLKAELLVQGLEIDEIDVSVAHDSHADGDPNQTAAEAAKHHASSDSKASDDVGPGEANRSQADGREAIAETAIDYFA